MNRKLTDFNVIIVIVDICFFPTSFTSRVGIFIIICHQVVHLYITLLDVLLFHFFLFLIYLLLVCVFMVNTVIEILIVQLLEVTVQFTNTWVESNHNVFVLHHSHCCSYNFVSCFVASLGIEWTEDN
jgi:hypothetical protein